MKFKYGDKVIIKKTGETGVFTTAYTHNGCNVGVAYNMQDTGKHEIKVGDEYRWLESKEFRPLADIRKNGK